MTKLYRALLLVFCILGLFSHLHCSTLSENNLDIPLVYVLPYDATDESANGNQTVAEGDTAVFTIVVEGKSIFHEVTVDYTTLDGSATSDEEGGTNGDYVLDEGSVTINVNHDEDSDRTYSTISIPTVDDNEIEIGSSETFSVRLSNAFNATLDPTSYYAETARPSNVTFIEPSASTSWMAEATVQITDNDTDEEDAVSVSFDTADATLTEGESLALTLRLSEALSSDLTISYSVTGSTASEDDTNFEPSSNPLSVLAGESEVEITITATDDADEESDETLVFTIGSSTKTITIVDNDENTEAETPAPAVAPTASLQISYEFYENGTFIPMAQNTSLLPSIYDYLLVNYGISAAKFTLDASTSTGSSALTYVWYLFGEDANTSNNSAAMRTASGMQLIIPEETLSANTNRKFYTIKLVVTDSNGQSTTLTKTLGLFYDYAPPS